MEFYDGVRWVTIILAGFAAATLFRIALVRLRAVGWRTEVYPSPFATFGLALALAVAAGVRVGQLGENPVGWWENVSLFVLLAAVGLIVYGNLLTVRFNVPSLLTGQRRFRDDGE